MNDSPASTHQAHDVERTARRFWVTLVIGLLGLQIVIGVTSIALSVGDPSVSVVPNYHQAALDWDITHRARELARQLGWHVDATISRPDSPTGDCLMQVTVRDRAGNHLRGLAVGVQYFHHARGSRIYRVALTEAEDGGYVARVPLDRVGLWQLDMTIEGQHGIARASEELEVAY